MSSPDFNDFLRTITKQRYMDIADIINKENRSVKISISENGVDFGELSSAITATNIIYFEELLSDYHNWLMKELHLEPKD